jgi:hypothetical protein
MFRPPGLAAGADNFGVKLVQLGSDRLILQVPVRVE